MTVRWQGGTIWQMMEQSSSAILPSIRVGKGWDHLRLDAQHDGKLTMQTLLVTLLAVFLTVYFGAKRKYLLSALSIAVFFVLFRPEGLP